jgi:hypothetical protein
MTLGRAVLCNKSRFGSTLILNLNWSNNMESKSRPYLTAALLCERVLREVDGSISVIRIADKVYLQMQGPPGMQPLPIPAGMPEPVPFFNLTCLVALKSGPTAGEYTLRLTFESPSGKIQGEPIEQPVKLLGKDHGQNYIVQYFIAATEEGLHWVHVAVDDEELTRIPLMVVRQQAQQHPS